jgi:hypothetical protein
LARQFLISLADFVASFFRIQARRLAAELSLPPALLKNSLAWFGSENLA